MFSTNKDFKEKILHMHIPEYTCYSHNASSISIVSSHADSSNWLINNFNNLVIHNNQTTMFFIDSTYHHNPLIDCQRINKKLIGKNVDDYINFIIEAIEQNYYVYLIMNSKYISAYNRINNRPHDLLIFGYNSINRTFNIADNFVSGKFALSKCSFNELENSLQNLTDIDENFNNFNGCLELLRLNPAATLPIDVPYILNALNDYLNSTVSHPQSSFVRSNTYGFKIYEKLIEYLQSLKIENSNCDIRPFHVLWEHKKSILLKVMHFNKSLILDLSEDELKEFDYIVNKALIIRNLFMKYSLTKNNELIDKMIDLLSDIKLREFKALSTFLLKITDLQFQNN